MQTNKASPLHFLQLAQGDAAMLGIIFEYCDDELAWCLTCKNFYSIAKAKQLEDEAILFDMSNFQFQRILAREKLRKVSFSSCLGFVVPVVERHAAHLEKINLCHLPENFTLPKDLVLPNLKRLTFCNKMWYNPAMMIQQWVERAVNLQTVVFSLSILPQSDREEMEKWMVDVISQVSRVPCVNLETKEPIYRCVELLGSKLRKLDIVVNTPMWWKHFDKLYNLQELALSYRSTEPLTHQIALCLPKLVQFTLRDFKLCDPQSEAIIFQWIPVTVERLIISFSRLQSFPNVQHLCQLSKLHMFYTVIESATVPSWIYKFSCLQNLKIAIREFDNTQMQDLNLLHVPQSCKLLIASMCNLSGASASPLLTHFDISKSVVPEIRKVLSASPKIKSLHIKSCKNITIDADFPFHKMKRLQTIRISNQVVQSFPDISMLSCLTDLTLHSCGISSIPVACAKLPNLQLLDLRENKITEIDASLFDDEAGSFANLLDLNLVKNPIGAYPPFLNIAKIENIAISPLCDKLIDSPQVPPANIDRTEWTQFALQHMKHARENFTCYDGSQQIQLVYLDYAIPCKNNKMLLCCHMSLKRKHFAYTGSMELQDYARSEVLILVVHLPSKTVQFASSCGHIESLL